MSRGQAVKTIAGIAVFIAFLAGVFVAAGTVRWLEAWLYFGFYMTATSGLIVWLKSRRPGLLAERRSPGRNAKRWDRIIIRIYTGVLVAMFIVAALDARRFGWSHVPPGLRISGWVLIMLAGAFGFWAFRENAFLAAYVRIQTDRGHQVCTTGPYRIVRHPMYVAVIIVVLATPVVLGSFWALVPAALVAALFVLRTSLEDKTLRAELQGYETYAAATRSRLIPGLW